jgi:citrate lyase subunit beta / citryl-CoA lyase
MKVGDGHFKAPNAADRQDARGGGEPSPQMMRSKLFVPGSRPELFEKAYLSAADAISFDLEDAVAAARKAEARAFVAEALGKISPGLQKTIVVRVNGFESGHFDADLEAIVRARLDVVNLPKVESADQIKRASERLARFEEARRLSQPIAILANIETPRGVRLAADIALADPRVIGLQIGFGDLFEPYGIARHSRAAVDSIRLSVRLAAAEAQLPAYDGAFVAVDDPQAFRAEAQQARDLGLAGKSCVHPTQVPLANAVFSPTAAEIEKARKIVAAAADMEARGVGAFTFEGVMVDQPFIVQARAVLAAAEENGRGA